MTDKEKIRALSFALNRLANALSLCASFAEDKRRQQYEHEVAVALGSLVVAGDPAAGTPSAVPEAVARQAFRLSVAPSTGNLLLPPFEVVTEKPSFLGWLQRLFIP